MGAFGEKSQSSKQTNPQIHSNGIDYESKYEWDTYIMSRDGHGPWTRPVFKDLGL